MDAQGSALWKLPVLGENMRHRRQVKLPPYQGTMRAGKPNWVRAAGVLESHQLEGCLLRKAS